MTSLNADKAHVGQPSTKSLYLSAGHLLTYGLRISLTAKKDPKEIYLGFCYL